jgi:hypothetical protein
MMDTNGIPDITGTPGSGVFHEDAGQHALLGLSGPAQSSVASIVQTMLEQTTAAQNIGVDTSRREIWCGPVAGGNVVSLVGSIESAQKVYRLKPTAGQTGRSLEWEVDTGASSGDFPATTKSAVDALLAPAKPKYSLPALMQRICAALPEGKEVNLIANQEDGWLEVLMNANGTAPQDPGLSDCTSDGGVVVTLSEPTVTGAALKNFEGAAT